MLQGNTCIIHNYGGKYNSFLRYRKEFQEETMSKPRPEG